MMAQVSALLMSFVRRVAAPSGSPTTLLLRSRERAQDLVEYGIAIAVIAVVALASIQAFGGGISTFFGRLLSRFSGLG